MTKLFPLGSNPLPPPPPFLKLIGPSFIILGLGLGSGEVILWPYLASNHGLGLVWAIVLGVTMQFFINMEVERYALIYGESIFVGFARWLRFLPLWFIVSTFIGFGWPGIGLAGATLIQNTLGINNIKLVATISFVVIGLILSLGKQLYKTVETLQKFLFILGTPIIFFLTLYLSKPEHWQALSSGLMGQGLGFSFFPAGLSLTSFVAAIAFSGAGGNLNLSQSFYIRDKGYGMGKYADKISSIFTNSQAAKTLKLTGSTFPVNSSNLNKFRQWWHAINLEHFLIFWFLGLITMLTLSLLSYITAFGHPGNPEGINFVITESKYIAQSTLPIFGTFFLVVTGLMLTATQLTVLDSTSRIITENILLLKGSSTAKISLVYYLVLWLQIAFGIAVFNLGFTQPRQLITFSAVINAFTMAVYTGLILYYNNKHLHHALRPNLLRNIALLFSMIFLFVSSLLSLTTK
jgi:hypothetical protein